MILINALNMQGCVTTVGERTVSYGWMIFYMVLVANGSWLMFTAWKTGDGCTTRPEEEEEEVKEESEASAEEFGGNSVELRISYCNGEMRSDAGTKQEHGFSTALWHRTQETTDSDTFSQSEQGDSSCCSATQLKNYEIQTRINSSLNTIFDKLTRLRKNWTNTLVVNHGRWVLLCVVVGGGVPKA